MQGIKSAVRQYILDRHLAGEPADQLKDDTPLQTSGILDSLAVLELAAFVGERFGVELSFGDTTVERFDRLEQIAEVISRRQRETERKPS
jgi:acyl carrier protein